MVVAVAPGALVVGLVAEATGGHDTRWAGLIVGVAMLTCIAEVLLLLGWWEQSREARAERRRLRDPVLRRERREARIADLEADLGFGAFDEIAAIRDLDAGPVP
jgi:hypothetical protein